MDFCGKCDRKIFLRSFVNACRKKDRKIAIATLALLVALKDFLKDLNIFFLRLFGFESNPGSFGYFICYLTLMYLATTGHV
jgi:hypothetical protein